MNRINSSKSTKVCTLSETVFILIRHKFKNNKKDYSRQKQEPPFYLDNEILFKSQGIRYLHITYVTRSH